MRKWKCKWRLELFSPWNGFSYTIYDEKAEDLGTHTLLGKFADMIADGIEGALPPIVALAGYQHFRELQRLGKIRIDAIEHTTELNTITSKIVAIRPLAQIPQLITRGNSDQRREGCDMYVKELLEQIAPEEHAQNDIRDQRQRLSFEIVTEHLDRKRKCQDELDRLHSELETAVSRAESIVRHQPKDEDVRRGFQLAIKLAIKALLQRGVETQNVLMLRGTMQHINAFLHDMEEEATDEDEEGDKEADEEATNHKDLANAAKGVIDHFQDQRGPHSARVNVTLHSLDSNSHLVTRTLMEEPMSEMVRQILHPYKFLRSNSEYQSPATLSLFEQSSHLMTPRPHRRPCAVPNVDFEGFAQFDEGSAR